MYRDHPSMFLHAVETKRHCSLHQRKTFAADIGSRVLTRKTPDMGSVKPRRISRLIFSIGLIGPQGFGGFKTRSRAHTMEERVCSGCSCDICSKAPLWEISPVQLFSNSAAASASP